MSRLYRGPKRTTHKVLDVRRLYLREMGRTVEGSWWMVERGTGRRTGGLEAVIWLRQKQGQHKNRRSLVTKTQKARNTDVGSVIQQTGE